MIFPLKVGITGGIGSGKTIVCKILEAMGYPVFYSDQVAKELMYTDKQLRIELVELIGEDTYIEGELNRQLIAQKVFTTPELLSKINALVHPKVRVAYTKFVRDHSDSTFVFNEAAILFETGAYKSFDAVILVTANEDIRIQRVMERDQITVEQVRVRMKNQWSDEAKRKMTEFVISNNDTNLLVPQVESILADLAQKK